MRRNGDPLHFTFKAKVWKYTGKAAWHFITLPAPVAASIRFLQAGAPGFGMVKVRARIGSSEWKTSVFPDSNSGSYLLPVKADVRKIAEDEFGALGDTSTLADPPKCSR